MKLVILGDRKTLVRDYPPFRTIEKFFSEDNYVNLTDEDIEDVVEI